MAGNIKGITIELNGDTTKLDKALRSVNNETRTVQKQLSEVEKALKMNPGNTDLIKQKERLLGEEIKATEDKLKMQTRQEAMRQKQKHPLKMHLSMQQELLEISRLFRA